MNPTLVSKNWKLINLRHFYAEKTFLSPFFSLHSTEKVLIFEHFYRHVTSKLQTYAFTYISRAHFIYLT